MCCKGCGEVIHFELDHPYCFCFTCHRLPCQGMFVIVLVQLTKMIFSVDAGPKAQLQGIASFLYVNCVQVLVVTLCSLQKPVQYTFVQFHPGAAVKVIKGSDRDHFLC